MYTKIYQDYFDKTLEKLRVGLMRLKEQQLAKLEAESAIEATFEINRIAPVGFKEGSEFRVRVWTNDSDQAEIDRGLEEHPLLFELAKSRDRFVTPRYGNGSRLGVDQDHSVVIRNLMVNSLEITCSSRSDTRIVQANCDKMEACIAEINDFIDAANEAIRNEIHDFYTGQIDSAKSTVAKRDDKVRELKQAGFKVETIN